MVVKNWCCSDIRVAAEVLAHNDLCLSPRFTGDLSNPGKAL